MKAHLMRGAFLWVLAAGMAGLAGAQNPSVPTAKESAVKKLPSDVNAESLSRLPNVRREEMDELGKKMYDTVVGGQARSIAGLQGPYGVWLHSPQLAEKALPLIYYLRYE